MDLSTENGFRQLYRLHYAALHYASFRILGDSQAAEDVVHQVFLKLWEQRDRVKVSNNPGGYLRRSVINTSLNYLKKHRHLTPMDEIAEHDLVEETSCSTEQQQQAILEKLHLTVDSLPPKCRLIFSLSRYEGLSNQEIADHLGVTRKTVENQLNKAFSRIRNSLGPYLKYLSFIFAVLVAQIFF